MLVKNTLNNMALRNYRHDRMYQAIITDLTLLGIVPEDKAEMLLGYEVPDYLNLPDGTSINKPVTTKKPDLSKLKDLEE